jgi:calcium-binding protein CML
VLFLLVADEDSNGAIDHAELKKCFNKLEISFTEEEINDLFEACDINENMGMKFTEFIVLLCLVYLLKDDPVALHAVSRKYFLYVFPFQVSFYLTADT